jgi:hypothetical protein
MCGRKFELTRNGYGWRSLEYALGLFLVIVESHFRYAQMVPLMFQTPIFYIFIYDSLFESHLSSQQ